MTDWNHINTLLSVIHQASAAGPKLVKIAAMATDELMEYFAPKNEVPKSVAPPKDTEDFHVVDPNLGAERLPERRI